jgi:hypothetical protein
MYIELDRACSDKGEYSMIWILFFFKLFLKLKRHSKKSFADLYSLASYFIPQTKETEKIQGVQYIRYFFTKKDIWKAE